MQGNSATALVPSTACAEMNDTAVAAKSAADVLQALKLAQSAQDELTRRSRRRVRVLLMASAASLLVSAAVFAMMWIAVRFATDSPLVRSRYPDTSSLIRAVLSKGGSQLVRETGSAIRSQVDAMALQLSAPGPGNPLSFSAFQLWNFSAADALTSLMTSDLASLAQSVSVLAADFRDVTVTMASSSWMHSVSHVADVVSAVGNLLGNQLLPIVDPRPTPPASGSLLDNTLLSVLTQGRRLGMLESNEISWEEAGVYCGQLADTLRTQIDWLVVTAEQGASSAISTALNSSWIDDLDVLCDRMQLLTGPGVVELQSTTLDAVTSLSFSFVFPVLMQMPRELAIGVDGFAFDSTGTCVLSTADQSLQVPCDIVAAFDFIVVVVPRPVAATDMTHIAGKACKITVSGAHVPDHGFVDSHAEIGVAASFADADFSNQTVPFVNKILSAATVSIPYGRPSRPSVSQITPFPFHATVLFQPPSYFNSLPGARDQVLVFLLFNGPGCVFPGSLFQMLSYPQSAFASGIYQISFNSLESGTAYSVQVVASNSFGHSTGSQCVPFRTSSGATPALSLTFPLPRQTLLYSDHREASVVTRIAWTSTRSSGGSQTTTVSAALLDGSGSSLWSDTGLLQTGWLATSLYADRTLLAGVELCVSAVGMAQDCIPISVVEMISVSTSATSVSFMNNGTAVAYETAFGSLGVPDGAFMVASGLAVSSLVSFGLSAANVPAVVGPIVNVRAVSGVVVFNATALDEISQVVLSSYVVISLPLPVASMSAAGAPLQLQEETGSRSMVPAAQRASSGCGDGSSLYWAVSLDGILWTPVNTFSGSSYIDTVNCNAQISLSQVGYVAVITGAVGTTPSSPTTYALPLAAIVGVVVICTLLVVGIAFSAVRTIREWRIRRGVAYERGEALDS